MHGEGKNWTQKNIPNKWDWDLHKLCVKPFSGTRYTFLRKLKLTIKREVQYKTLRSLTAKTKGARKEPEKSQKQYFGDSFRSTEPIFLKFGTNLY